MTPLTPTERWCEHRGDISCLSGSTAVSALGSDPPARHLNALSGAVPVDASPAPPDAESTNEGSTSGFEPGRRSLSQAEIQLESIRIQLMIQNHRWKLAEQERLYELALAQEWLS